MSHWSRHDGRILQRSESEYVLRLGALNPGLTIDRTAPDFPCMRNRSDREVPGNCVGQVHPGHEPFLY